MRSIAILTALCFSFPAAAYFQLDFLKSKNSTKANSQWTLADWLGQKGKMKLADQWLALNRSQDGFEFNPSAAHNRYSVRTQDTSGTVSSTGDAQTYTLDMHISIFNLYGEYEKTSANQEEFGGAAGLRLFGTSSQTTTLIARYGWRRLQDLTTTERWDNQFAEGQLQLYIIRSMGLLGQYRHYFPSESQQGTRLEGHRVTAGAFIEPGFFRLFANYYQQPTRFTRAGAVSEQRREGYDAGVKFFF